MIYSISRETVVLADRTNQDQGVEWHRRLDSELRGAIYISSTRSRSLCFVWLTPLLLEAVCSACYRSSKEVPTDLHDTLSIKYVKDMVLSSLQRRCMFDLPRIASKSVQALTF
jgi:hypothetical protein